MTDCLYACLEAANLEQYHANLLAAGVARCDQLADLSLSHYSCFGISGATDRLRLYKLVQIVRSVRADGFSGCDHGISATTSSTKCVDAMCADRLGKLINGGDCNHLSNESRQNEINRSGRTTKTGSNDARINGVNKNGVEYHEGCDLPVFRCRKTLNFSSESDPETATTVPAQSAISDVCAKNYSSTGQCPKPAPSEHVVVETHAYFPPPSPPTKDTQVETIYHDTGYDYGLPNTETQSNVRATEHDIAENSLDRIRVCVRKRPLLAKERNRNDADIVGVTDRRTVSISEDKVAVDLTKFLQRHVFTFDEVFNENCSNEFVYKKTVKSLVDKIVKKGCATCFAFGQTGAGKTHTLLGGRGTRGLYQMAAQDILSALRSSGRPLRLWVSYYEIYCGQLFDLLNKRKRLQVRENAKQKVCITGLMETHVTEVKRITQVVNYGNNARRTGSTGVNATSSRSHAVLQLEIRDLQDTRIGRISFIDLAGSERASDVTDFDRQTRIEGAEINQSLLALKECIRSIDQDSRHTPYRQSKLTHILRDSFVGSDSHTVMIANISASQSACENTLNTLRYADRVKELRKSLPKVRSSTNNPTTNTTKQQQQPRQAMIVRKHLSLATPFHPSNVPCSSTPKGSRVPPGVGSADTLRRVLGGDADSPISGHRIRRRHIDNNTSRWKSERDLAASNHRASPTANCRLIPGQEGCTSMYSPPRGGGMESREPPQGSAHAALTGHRDVMSHIGTLIDSANAAVPDCATNKRWSCGATVMRRNFDSTENVHDSSPSAVLSGRELLQSLSQRSNGSVEQSRVFQRASSCGSIAIMQPHSPQVVTPAQSTQSAINSLDVAIRQLAAACRNPKEQNSDAMRNGDSAIETSQRTMEGLRDKTLGAATDINMNVSSNKVNDANSNQNLMTNPLSSRPSASTRDLERLHMENVNHGVVYEPWKDTRLETRNGSVEKIINGVTVEEQLIRSITESSQNGVQHIDVLNGNWSQKETDRTREEIRLANHTSLSPANKLRRSDTNYEVSTTDDHDKNIAHQAYKKTTLTSPKGITSYLKSQENQHLSSLSQEVQKSTVNDSESLHHVAPVSSRESLAVHRDSAFSKVADMAEDKPSNKPSSLSISNIRGGDKTATNTSVDSPIRTEKLGVVTVGATFAPIHRFPVTPGHEKSRVISVPRVITKTVIAKTLFSPQPLTSKDSAVETLPTNDIQKPPNDHKYPTTTTTTSLPHTDMNTDKSSNFVPMNIASTMSESDVTMRQRSALSNGHTTETTRAALMETTVHRPQMSMSQPSDIHHGSNVRSKPADVVQPMVTSETSRSDSAHSNKSSVQSNKSALQRAQSLLITAHEEELSDMTALCKKEMRLLMAVKAGTQDFHSYLEALPQIMSSKAESIVMLRSHIREYNHVSTSE